MKLNILIRILAILILNFDMLQFNACFKYIIKDYFIYYKKEL